MSASDYSKRAARGAEMGLMMRERWPAEDGDAEASTPEIERKRTRLPPAQPARRRIVRARIENATSATEAQPAKLHQAAADGRNGSR